jgi:hypothetical protein
MFDIVWFVVQVFQACSLLSAGEETQTAKNMFFLGEVALTKRNRNVGRLSITGLGCRRCLD